MGINAAWVDEKHEPIQAVFDTQGYLTNLAMDVWPDSQTACLRFIDPWGDTVFNQVQIPILLEELRNFANSVDREDTEDHLHKVISLVAQAVDNVHTYIKFIGD